MKKTVGPFQVKGGGKWVARAKPEMTGRHTEKAEMQVTVDQRTFDH